MPNSQEKLSQVALKLTVGVGDILMRQLVSHCGSASDVFKNNRAKLEKIPGIGGILAQELLSKKTFTNAEKIIESCQQKNVSILFYTESTYPQRLKALYDAPALLFYKGNATINTPRVIAIVGTRKATDYGKRITESIVEALQPYNVLISSGLAYGIDIATHRACIKYNIPTIGVMAHGTDKIYPAQHHSIAQDMLEMGGLLTEHSPEILPDPRYFPARNRIIAGMSDAIIVVEAAAKGGALITAEYANNYHREVFAVPGNVSNTYSEGCNKLIRENKAQIYTNITDIIDALNWDSQHSKGNLQVHDFSQFTTEESQLLAFLRQNGETQIDEISWKTQLSLNKLASLLLNLEFQGMIRALPGKKFTLT